MPTRGLVSPRALVTFAYLRTGIAGESLKSCLEIYGRVDPADDRCHIFESHDAHTARAERETAKWQLKKRRIYAQDALVFYHGSVGRCRTDCRRQWRQRHDLDFTTGCLKNCVCTVLNVRKLSPRDDRWARGLFTLGQVGHCRTL
jgi:hypothetical protein